MAKSHSYNNVMVYIFVILIIITSCSPSSIDFPATAQYLQDNPIPTPVYVLRYARTAHFNCLSITQETLWEGGFNDGALFEHIVNHSVIKIDNQIISRDNIDFTVRNASMPVLNDSNEVIGTYGGPITICLDTNGYSIGLHIATLEFTTLHGQPYMYTWVIEIHRNTEQIEPTLPQIPEPQPTVTTNP